MRSDVSPLLPPEIKAKYASNDFGQISYLSKFTFKIMLLVQNVKLDPSVLPLIIALEQSMLSSWTSRLSFSIFIRSLIDFFNI